MNLTKRSDDVIAVGHISAAIRGGGVSGLIGTNGAGKSTFLRLVSGMLKSDQGYIAIDGHEVFGNISAKKYFFYISDGQYFSNNTTPMEMMCYCSKMYQGFDEVRFHKLMGNFGPDEERKIYTFLKGMEKQVSVIYDVCTGTDYLFCDEASDGSDPVTRQAIKSIFAANMEDGNLTPIIASHNPRELEDIRDRVGLLHKGSIPLLKDLDDMKLNIHKIQCVPKPGVKPEDLIFLDKANAKQRGSTYTIAVQGSRSEVEAVIVSYEPALSERIPLSLEEIFISETEMAGYDIRRLIL